MSGSQFLQTLKATLQNLVGKVRHSAASLNPDVTNNGSQLETDSISLVARARDLLDHKDQVARQEEECKNLKTQLNERQREIDEAEAETDKRSRELDGAEAEIAERRRKLDRQVEEFEKRQSSKQFSPNIQRRILSGTDCERCNCPMILAKQSTDSSWVEPLCPECLKTATLSVRVFMNLSIQVFCCGHRMEPTTIQPIHSERYAFHCKKRDDHRYLLADLVPSIDDIRLIGVKQQDFIMLSPREEKTKLKLVG